MTTLTIDRVEHLAAYVTIIEFTHDHAAVITDYDDPDKPVEWHLRFRGVGGWWLPNPGYEGTADTFEQAKDAAHEAWSR